jgi:hypothetical protein
MSVLSPAPAPVRTSSLARLHWLLLVQSAVVVLVAINRRGDLTTGHVSGNEFFRWVDLLNLLVLPLISAVAFVLLKWWLAARADRDRQSALTWLVAIDMAFVVGVYVLGAGYGEHEVTNYLNGRYCVDGPDSQMCDIIAFHDDEFSHWLFFTGFLIVNVALLAMQWITVPGERLARSTVVLLLLNAVLIAAGIFANLAFEATGFDIPVVAALFAVSAWLLWRHPDRPLFVYYAAAYGLGFTATVAYKLGA